MRRLLIAAWSVICRFSANPAKTGLPLVALVSLAMRSPIVWFAVLAVTADAAWADSSLDAKRPHQAAVGVPIGDVHVSDPFWTPRVERCRDVTLPYCFEVCRQTGRIGNFEKAAGLRPGKFEGIWFNDSDVYKVVQGAALELGRHADDKLDSLADEVIAKIAAAQQSDGYLGTFFTLDNQHLRFKQIINPARHELYCMGHLIEAGAVHFDATGKRNLLDVACKLADHVDSKFGPGKSMMVPEHQEIELGLIELYRVTGQKRYLELARFFIDQRGNAEGHALYGPYMQDHEPVRESDEIVGHAVRAMYHCVGMADLYRETGDARLLAACRRLWESTTHRKMYVTGGVGATARGEAFEPDYVLPNESAYCETCAQIGLILLAHRLWLIEPRAEYADVLERALYNSFLSGLSLSGTKFFYQNRLAANGDYRRRDWYGCACCPSNVVRIYPALGRFIYGRQDRSVFVNLFISGSAELAVGDVPVTISQKTRYPWQGKIEIAVDSDRPCAMELCLRIPNWCRERTMPGSLYRSVARQDAPQPYTVQLNGKPIDVAVDAVGYARVERIWQPGDTVLLNLAMPVCRVYAHEKIAADVNRVALQRGPIVYCVEAVDHGSRIDHLILPREAPLAAEYRPELLGGVTALHGKATAGMVADESGRIESRPVDVVAIPYFAWDNRTGGAMAVWLPEDPALARPVPRPTVASRATATASHCWPRDAIGAVNDQIVPPSSHDLAVPRHTWWDHKGTVEWVQYDLAQPATVAGVEVFWFDDRRTGHCWVPQSWRVLARVDGRWQPVDNPTEYGVERDRFNRTTFTPVKTTALRVEARLRPECSAGVLEWRVLP